MIYGLNRFTRLNPIEEDCVFTTSDRDFLIETMTYAIQNDDTSLFEYCIDNSTNEVLQESVKDVVTTVIQALGKILGKIKTFVGEQFKKFKNWAMKISFKTNDNGDLTQEVTGSGETAASNESAYVTEGLLKGKWTSLYDLAGVELSHPIKIQNGVDLVPIKSNNVFAGYTKLYETQMGKIETAVEKLAKAKDNMDESEFADFKKEMDDIISEAVMTMDFASAGFGVDMTKVPDMESGQYFKLNKAQIANIIHNSQMNIPKMEASVNKQYKKADQEIKKLNDKIKPWASESAESQESFAKYKNYVAQKVETLSQGLANFELNINISLERSFESAVKIRKELENELCKLRRSNA